MAAPIFVTRQNLTIWTTPQLPIDSVVAADDLLLTAPVGKVPIIPAVPVRLAGGLVLAVGAIPARPVAVGRTPVIRDLVAFVLDAFEAVLIAVRVGLAAAGDHRVGCGNGG